MTVPDLSTLVPAVAAGLVVSVVIGWAGYEIHQSDLEVKQAQQQEQHFADQFYARCNSAGGSAATSNEGYVCWKGNNILFAFPEGQQTSDGPKG